MNTTDFTITREDKLARVHINRERLDTILSPRLKSEFVVLTGSGVQNIVLEMGDCKYCDSSGLSAILVGNRLCKNAGGRFIIIGISPAIERLITISQLDTVLSIAYNEAQVTSWLQ